MPLPRLRLHTTSLIALASFGILIVSGCHQDPTVRRQKYIESGKRYEAAGKYVKRSFNFRTR